MAAPGLYVDHTSIHSVWHDGLLILMYHAIETPPLWHSNRGLYIEPSKLRAQLGELRGTGTRFVSLTEWNRRRSREREIIVTFDDGFQNVFRHGLPILQELAVPAINYIVAGEIGGTNSWDRACGAQIRPLMSRDELLEWQRAGLEIGSHTLTHPHLTAIPLDQARHEIFDSKKILEDLCGRPVAHFAYPYGDWNPAIRDLVAEAGYETATVAHPGINSFESDRLTLRRFLATHRRPHVVALGRAFQRLLLNERRS
ncbi:MAG: polysaccharide deacetylase family protein [Methylacidiphilales bacterium]|nr:polysaccharide deacetylase family protein [Candidatus Methylacidiphilales bacterium]